nr:CLCA_X family protein [Agarivorans sp. TSD2052]
MGLYRDYYRRGPDYRHGDAVDFADIKHTFGFEGLAVGAWVTTAEKPRAASLIFDALADLAFLLNLPPYALGLRGSLRLAFGTGGQQNVQAHYAPASRTLALAKHAGAGALAHEWWHAFDHYMANKLFTDAAQRNEFASTRWLANDAQHQHLLNLRLDRLFAAVLLSPDGQNLNAFVSRSVTLDKQLRRRYFSLPTEMMARAFEAWIQSRTDIKNSYLVSGTKQTELAKAGAYPEPEHLRLIGEAALAYFELLGQALQSKGD